MSIKDNKNGTCTIDYRDNLGKRRRKTITGSKTLAKEVLNKIKTKIAEGTYFPERVKQSITFKEATEKYWKLHACTSKGASKSKYVIDSLVKKFGFQRLDQITTSDIQAFYNDKIQKTSPSTANRNFTVIRAIFNRAIAWDLFKGENPCNKVSRKRSNPAKLRFLSKEEMELLLNNAPDSIKPLLQCALMTGMRRGEILNLTWKDVDLENGMIYVRDSKSGKSREIPMIPELIEIFNKLDKNKNIIFDITIPCLRKRYYKLLNSVGITDCCFHTLRHSFASHFVMNNGSLSALQKILGHSSITLTMRYAHLAPDHIKKEMKILSPVFCFSC